MRRGHVAALVFFACVLAGAPALRAEAQSAAEAPTPSPSLDVDASAESKPDKPPAWETAKPERRGGFAMGFGIGAGVGASDGFPNDSAKIGHPAYHQNGGLGFGLGSTIWVGGALADWLSFGLGFGYSNIFASTPSSSSQPSLSTSSAAPYGTFHTDVYPLYALGNTAARKALRDLGAMFEFGLGFPKTVATKNESTIIDGAGSSYIFGGICWEGFSAWKLKMGPYVGIHYMFSDSIRRPLGIAGFRLTLYTAP